MRDFVYQNDAGDESQWTTVAWSTFGLDLAFKAYLSRHFAEPHDR